MSHPILLVEDDANDVFLLQRAFGRITPTPYLQVVNDGDAAVEYFSEQGIYADRDRYPLPVLMLLDLKLPRRSGLEVLAWLRQQPELKRLLVIVLTSSRETADINKAYELGANSYLVKPVAPEDLLKLVQTLNLYWLNLNEKPLL